MPTSFDEYSSIVRSACWYCGDFTYKGYSGVDRVHNAGTYQHYNVVASCHICNFMKGSLSVTQFLGKVEDIAREQHATSTGKAVNISEVVGPQIQFHHAGLIVDCDNLPARESGIYLRPSWSCSSN